MNQIFDTLIEENITVGSFLACSAVSLALGIVMAFCYTRKNKATQSFLLTLVIFPIIVQTVIMLVNGNLGTGIAVAGAFSLVRFRSFQGTAKDITFIFLAMAVGLATGTGFIMVAVLLTAIVCVIYLFITMCRIGSVQSEEKELKITIPETLDYAEIFDDIFAQFLQSQRLVEVKTTNLGSMYKLKYCVVLKKDAKEKELLDALRTRNGNLEIAMGRPVATEQL